MTEEPALFLIGPRGCGKSGAAQAAAALLGLAWYDTDRMVEHAAGCSIAALVGVKGWQFFRQLEAEALALAAGKGGLIATGGGVVLAQENCRLMRARGLVVYLHAPAPCLEQRLAANPEAARRPSLTGKGLLEEIEAVLEERHPLYLACAQHVLDASLPLADVAAALADLARSRDPHPKPF